MTKKFKNGVYGNWFDLTVGPVEGGRVIRYYVITCHDCGRQNSYHANNLGDAALRKLFARRGWDIGKTRSAHFCHECKHKQPARVAAEPQQADPAPSPTAAMTKLEAAWQAASDDDRLEFFLKMQEQFAPPPDASVKPEPKPVIEDDEAPADWWTELQQQKELH